MKKDVCSCDYNLNLKIGHCQKSGLKCIKQD